VPPYAACLLASTVCIALAATGCSAASSPASAGPADAGRPGDAGEAALDAGAPTSCDDSHAERPDGGTCVLEVEGTVADYTGTPLPGLLMTFCGPPQCYGSQADGTGAYVIPVGDYVRTGDFAVHVDGRPDHAVDYDRLSPGEPEVISVDIRTPVLPPSTVSLPANGAPASEVTVGDVTLQVAAGTTFTLDIEDFSLGAAGRLFRVASVPLASAPPYAALNGVNAIYALAPSGAKPSTKMGVLVRNSAGLPASSAVDVLVLSDDYFSNPPTVGTLVLAAKAHVSADGATIQTDPGEGINEITWLAVRKGI